MKTKMDMTPKDIVAELDRYIVGQADAKKAVAIALRNRYRRLQVDGEMQKEITPKNILMIGPTGVGKTEIARRLASFVRAPFVKVEATKFTEVGYVGRDVESMVRDLVEEAIRIVKAEQFSNVYAQAERNAVKELAKILAPGIKKEKKQTKNPLEDMFKNMGMDPDEFMLPEEEPEEQVTKEISSKRSELEKQSLNGELDDREVTIQLTQKNKQAGPVNPAMEQMGIDLSETFNALRPAKKIKRTVSVKEAKELLTEEEAGKLVNQEDTASEAIALAQQSGIIFIDEIDKITSTDAQSGQVSREGVQRDILPIVEGSTVQTKHGVIQTDHILFIGSGAFHTSAPSDLIPELQGRFPIRVELDDLTKEDFIKILTEPHNSLVKQYKALLETENVVVVFTYEAVERLAEIAYEVNEGTDNIGARRLHTILEKLLEELLFTASEMQMGEVKITAKYVDDKLGYIVKNHDLSRYIL